MPGGLDFQSPTSYFAFGTIKFAAYTSYAAILRRWLQHARAEAYVIGGMRTVIGMIVGGVFLYTLTHLTSAEAYDMYWLCLIPIRAVEWWLILWLFFEKEVTTKRWVLAIVVGILVSYAADIPAAIGWFFCGGFYVCDARSIWGTVFSVN